MSRYFRNVWDGVVTVLIGMKITWAHLFTRAVTIQYPDVKVKLPDRARNRLYVNMETASGATSVRWRVRRLHHDRDG
jgi:NADH-quinone oxidoreductase subunit I